ncbi:MAG: queuosine precursor transporter [Cytophagales bacterium]|nr:queuosine precursor transporter [Cytophagales bacterium]
MNSTFAPDKKQILYLSLGGVFITCALTAEFIGTKIFSLEKLLGLSPAQITFFGDYTLDFNLTAGVLIWPVVFIISDIVNEYYGVKGVKIISYLTASLVAMAFVIVYVATLLPPADFWLSINAKDPANHKFDINFAYNTIFRQGMGIIIGSLFAFLIGQVTDAYIFSWVKAMTQGRYIWLRATGSTIVSQLIDSFVVLFIAFYVFGNWEVYFVLAVGTMNFMYKMAVAILLTPLLYLAHYLIDIYLQKIKTC